MACLVRDVTGVGGFEASFVKMVDNESRKSSIYCLETIFELGVVGFL